jgi:hypothetical protein
MLRAERSLDLDGDDTRPAGIEREQINAVPSRSREMPQHRVSPLVEHHLDD